MTFTAAFDGFDDNLNGRAQRGYVLARALKTSPGGSWTPVA
ncbi:MAG TPA: hypothetical protein VNT92_06965 [Acidimicrobiia bacterium]|nr:hypothetical protein [Acidimicrobiia bacterium]